MILVLAEKPSVASSIATIIGATKRKDGYYEGNDYLVSWCVGHLVELSTAESYNPNFAKWSYDDLPILPNDFKFNISKGKEKQVKIIRDLAKRNDVVLLICATDAGREGELIFRLVYNQIDCHKPIQRLWISSMEDDAIRKGFDNLHNGDDFENLYQAALCRSKADWLVGINATRLFSVLYGQTLNVGRVMSPTLAMIVERDANISSFKSEPFYNVQLDFEGFSLVSDKIKDKTQALELANACNNQNISIESVVHKEKVVKPPKLYDLTTLQREANKLLGFTAEQTLSYAQTLYEKKLLTYPRTDSRFLTEDMKNSTPTIINAISQLLIKQSNNLQVNVTQVIDNSKVTDHHAIIPTLKAKDQDFNALSLGEREILKLVAFRLLTATSENHCYGETSIKSTFNGFNFIARGKTVLSDGFRTIEQLQKNTQVKEEIPLPKMNEGDSFVAKSSIKEGKTTPPKPYTDDTLLSSMENANNAVEDSERKGIGTPATRAGIMEKLIKTDLVQRQGNQKTKYFVPTHKGVSLITVLPETIRSPLLTAEWEEKLKQIEQGKLSSYTFLAEINEMTQTLVKTYEVIKSSNTLFPKQNTGDIVGTCPRCGGEVTENKKGFCCSNKACGFAIWKENRFFSAKKKLVTKALVKELIKNGKVALNGCYSEKTGKIYDCIILLDDDGGKYVNFKMEFLKK